MKESTSLATLPKRRRFPAGTVLAVLALLYTLYFARSFLMPITIALLLDFLLSPAVRALVRLHIPQALSAALVVLTMLALTGLTAYRLAGPVQDWVERAPEALATAQRELRRVLLPLEQVSKTAQQVESAAAAGAGTKTPEVVVRGPSLAVRLFGSTQRFLARLLEVVILLYFLLAAGDLFLQKMIKVLPHLPDKLKAVKIARETELSISTYLVTTAFINVVEGAIVAGAMQLIGMPNPVLWGALVAVLEFIPYLGAVTVVVVLFIAALQTFSTVGHALIPPGAFLLVNLVQVNLLSPVLLGHRLALNPVALFVGLAFWFWIWGVAGAFIGVPLMATFKICCDHIEALKPVGEFLGQRDTVPRNLPA